MLLLSCWEAVLLILTVHIHYYFSFMVFHGLFLRSELHNDSGLQVIQHVEQTVLSCI